MRTRCKNHHPTGLLSGWPVVGVEFLAGLLALIQLLLAEIQGGSKK